MRTDLYCLCADWCGICRQFQSIFDRFGVVNPQLRMHWIDIEDEADRLGEFEVETFPTLLIVQDGLARFLGPVQPTEAALRQLLDRAGEWRLNDPESLTLVERLVRESPR